MFGLLAALDGALQHAASIWRRLVEELAEAVAFAA
jgi:hypothetical protein